MSYYYQSIDEDKVFECVKNGIRLTEQEVHFLVAECACEEGDNGGGMRWVTPMYSIINVDGQHYILYWYRGLTEYQENEYPDQVAKKVQKVTRIVTIEDWEEIE